MSGSAYLFGETINFTYLAEWAECIKLSPTEVANLYAIIGEYTSRSSILAHYMLKYRLKWGSAVRLGAQSCGYFNKD